MRKLHNPDKIMRVVQYRILSRILDQVETPDYIHGFERGKSIPKMAAVHTGKDVVISLDIKDFFPSIKQYMVEKVFNAIGVTEIAGRVVSELCTYRYYVPQGSLTAPKISNLIAAGTFGPVIDKFCKENQIDMTIYADDITMSYTKDFASLEEAKSFTASVIQFVTAAVTKAGFTINAKKTKIMRPHNRQWVCGAVVNSHVNMRKTERALLRAIVHNCEKNGVEEEAKKTNQSVDGFIRKYAGRINWLLQLNPDAGMPLKLAFRKVTKPYLKKHPEIEIPELAWNSSIEMTEDMLNIEEQKPDVVVVSDFTIQPAASAEIVKNITIS